MDKGTLKRNEFSCSSCEKSYTEYKNLRRHVNQVHPENLNTIAPLAVRKYKCSFCKKQYNTKVYLSSHERKVHNVKYYVPLFTFERSHCINILKSIIQY
ncbi:hypothetical protein NQ317_004266 [Molorchus minor]|uniref:C2H2-type domain-containing protein n=1 Tax=Molorchus minor TaxID=1323400 RepID=A0ABQ9JZ66_9CUCU|nr:hypothetical protein NQ317_004266 [Molorchus minor]